MTTLLKIFIRKVTISFLLVCSFSSCDNFVEVELPDTQLTAPLVFEDKATANAALTAIYSKIREGGLLTGSFSGMSNQLGLYTDELHYYGDAQSISSSFYNNTLSPSATDLASLWNSSYSQVYAANAVLEGLANSTTLSQEDSGPMRGEALFIRALLHFYLTDLYGEVPYVTATDYRQNSSIVKIAVQDVYAKALQDLEEALTLLPDTYPQPDRVRPNKFAAYTLMARLHLYAGNWEMAANEASAVINESLFSIGVPPENAFLKGSPETIWQLAPGVPGGNTLEGSTFLFVSGPPPGSALREELVMAFEPGDLRFLHWVGSVTDGVNTWYHPNKYKLTLYAGGDQEYSKIFRLAELYLIRSEARARQGDLIGAREDLNIVRMRAGLPGSLAATAEELIDAVLYERRVELFTEFGHRFFDLKRFGRLDMTLEALKPGWENTDSLFPVPAVEIGLNPGVGPQNPGY